MVEVEIEVEVLTATSTSNIAFSGFDSSSTLSKPITYCSKKISWSLICFWPKSSSPEGSCADPDERRG